MASFDFGAASLNEYGTPTNVHPEWEPDVAPTAGGRPAFFQAFYIGMVLYSALVIATVCAGTIYNKEQCASWNDGALATATTFEVFAFIVAFLALIVIVMSILALSYKMGFSELIESKWHAMRNAVRNYNIKAPALPTEPQFNPAANSTMETEMQPMRYSDIRTV